MQPGFFVILLARQAQVLLQIMRIIFTEHIPPGVVFSRPVCFSVIVNQRLRQAAVVAVVQVNCALRWPLRSSPSSLSSRVTSSGGKVTPPSCCSFSARLRRVAFCSSAVAVSMRSSGVKLPGRYTVWIRAVSVWVVVRRSPSQPYQTWLTRSGLPSQGISRTTLPVLVVVVIAVAVAVAVADKALIPSGQPGGCRPGR